MKMKMNDNENTDKHINQTGNNIIERTSVKPNDYMSRQKSEILHNLKTNYDKT